MNDKDEILRAILSLQEATELGFKAVDDRFAAHETRLGRIEREMREGFDRLERQLR